MGETDTHTNGLTLSSSGVAALVAVIAETLRERDESFLENLKANAGRLYDLLERTDMNADVSEALETIRLLEEYLNLLQQQDSGST